MAISTAVGTEIVSRVVGYEVQKGNFQESTPNLPMRIAIFGQANTANQPADDSPVQVTSEAEAGQIFGFGSMIHQMMRIIRARTGDRIGGIPTIIYPQLAPAGAAAQVDDLTITGGPATAAAVHIVKINGRSNFDGASLEIAVAVGDTVSDVAQKIADAINNAQNAPVTASNAAGVVTITTKWEGESAAELDIEVDTQSNPVGLSYAVTEDTPAAGDSSAEITASLAKFGNDWNTSRS
jgi:phage tail sheath gpL-like